MQLPDVWEYLVNGRTVFHDLELKVLAKLKTTGTESGQAYGKALRSVESRVGTSGAASASWTRSPWL